ncbi:MAG: preprotein translocase subunit SecG [bacterium]|nr:preprotein translocase subunit SecG [bacterium]
MHAFVFTIHILVAIFIILAILMQQREGGLSTVFGGGQSIFGGRGAAPFLTKTTIVLFILFLLTSFSLTLMSGKTKPRSAIERAVKKGEVAPIPYEEE